MCPNQNVVWGDGPPARAAMYVCDELLILVCVLDTCTDSCIVPVCDNSIFLLLIDDAACVITDHPHYCKLFLGLAVSSRIVLTTSSPKRTACNSLLLHYLLFKSYSCV